MIQRTALAKGVNRGVLAEQQVVGLWDLRLTSFALRPVVEFAPDNFLQARFL